MGQGLLIAEQLLRLTGTLRPGKFSAVAVRVPRSPAKRPDLMGGGDGNLTREAQFCGPARATAHAPSQQPTEVGHRANDDLPGVASRTGRRA